MVKRTKMVWINGNFDMALRRGHMAYVYKKLETSNVGWFTDGLYNNSAWVFYSADKLNNEDAQSMFEPYQILDGCEEWLDHQNENGTSDYEVLRPYKFGIYKDIPKDEDTLEIYFLDTATVIDYDGKEFDADDECYSEGGLFSDVKIPLVDSDYEKANYTDLSPDDTFYGYHRCGLDLDVWRSGSPGFMEKLRMQIPLWFWGDPETVLFCQGTNGHTYISGKIKLYETGKIENIEFYEKGLWAR